MGTTKRTVAWLVVCSALAPAHDVISTKLTWTQEVSRILLRRCLGCHREGGSAPMALTSYALARPWAKAIKEEVLERRMPPWGAVDGFGDLAGDISLTAEEIHVLADWVEGGAPEGDPQYLPPGLATPPPIPGPYQPQGVPTRLSNGIRLQSALRLIAIEAAAPVRATAELPGGRMIPLIWIHRARPQRPVAYAFRTPIDLPPATRIRLSGAGEIRVWIKPQ